MAYRILVAVVAMLLIGCNPPSANKSRATTQAVTEDFRDAAFGVAQWGYVTHDSAGDALTRGCLTLPYPLQEGVRFYGSWQARYVGPIDQQDKVGPQINGGKLSGELNKGQLTLELNPNMADNNVNLTGKVSGDRLVGEWEYSNFTGSVAKGSFEALLSKQ